MKQIAVICATLIVIVVGIVGCLAIFDIISFDLSQSIVFKVAGATALLGVCAFLIAILVRSARSSSN